TGPERERVAAGPVKIHVPLEMALEADVKRPRRSKMGGVDDCPVLRLEGAVRGLLPPGDVQLPRSVTPLAGDTPTDRGREPLGDAPRLVRDTAVAGDTRRVDPAIEPLV